MTKGFCSFQTLGTWIHWNHMILTTHLILNDLEVMQVRRVWCLTHLHEFHFIWMCRSVSLKSYSWMNMGWHSMSLITHWISLPVHREIVMQSQHYVETKCANHWNNELKIHSTVTCEPPNHLIWEISLSVYASLFLYAMCVYYNNNRIKSICNPVLER